MAQWKARWSPIDVEKTRGPGFDPWLGLVFSGVSTAFFSLCQQISHGRPFQATFYIFPTLCECIKISINLDCDAANPKLVSSCDQVKPPF